MEAAEEFFTPLCLPARHVHLYLNTFFCGVMLSIDRRACRNCMGRGDSDKVLTGKVTLTHLQLLVRSMLVQDVWPVTVVP